MIKFVRCLIEIDKVRYITDCEYLVEKSDEENKKDATEKLLKVIEEKDWLPASRLFYDARAVTSIPTMVNLKQSKEIMILSVTVEQGGKETAPPEKTEAPALAEDVKN